MKNLKNKTHKLTDDIKIGKNSIEHDNYDEHAFRDIIESNPKIMQTNVEGTKSYAPFNELHLDLFNALFKYEPAKVPVGKIAHTHQLNAQIIEAIMESPKYKDLRNITKLDPLTSTVGTEALGDEVRELIEELKDEYNKIMDDIEKAQAAAEKSEEDADGKPANSEEAIAYEEAKKRLEEHMKKANEIIQKQEKRQLNKIVEDVTNVAKETSDLISNWGLDQSATFQTSGYQDKLALLDKLRNSKKLKEIAALAGRYKRMAISSQKEKVKRGMDAVYDIKPGNDLGKILPSELLKLVEPDLEMLFMVDLIEEKTLQYEYSGKQKKHKGPIIVAIDSSGSMSGQPEIWAKSVAMGLLEIARIQKRSLFVMHFEAGSKETIFTNSFPKNKPYDLEEILRMAEYFACGGTEFEPPLDLARDKIEADGDFNKADIVFVTDGYSAVRDSWLKDYLKWKKAKNVKIYSVLIDAYANSDSAIKTFSDRVDKLSTVRKDVADDLAMQLFMTV